MAADLKSRILARLDELSLSARDASLRAGGSESLLQNVLSGKSKTLRADYAEAVAGVLGVTTKWLLTGKEPPPAAASEVRAAPGLTLNNIGSLPRDVPVVGTVAGSELGKGAFQLTPEVVDYVRRPPGLIGARDVYALYVEGESMSPKFEPGDLVFVHPHRKTLPGDYVVIQEPDSNNGEARGFIKRLVAITAKLIRTEQFNPKAHVEFVIRPGVIVHKVMTDGDLYGL